MKGISRMAQFNRNLIEPYLKPIRKVNKRGTSSEVPRLCFNIFV
jgi:hypothetical protein